jgi:hypothetical protein
MAIPAVMIATRRRPVTSYPTDSPPISTAMIAFCM